MDGDTSVYRNDERARLHIQKGASYDTADSGGNASYRVPLNASDSALQPGCNIRVDHYV